MDLDQFMKMSIQKISEQGIQVVNELIVNVDYLNARALLLIENPTSIYDSEADDYIIVNEALVSEWEKDVNTNPSLSEEEFYESVKNCLLIITQDIHNQNGFTVLNHSLPFAIELHMEGFPEEELFSISIPVTNNDATTLNTSMQEDFGEALTNPEYAAALSQSQQQMQSMYANIPGMENFQMPNMEELMGQAANALADCMEEGNEEKWQISHSPVCNTNAQQQRLLALGAIMKVAREEYIDTIEGSEAGMEDAREMFAAAWDASDRESAIEVLEWLKTEGHRSIYQAVRLLMEKYPWYEVRQEIVNQIPKIFNITNKEENEIYEMITKALSFYDNIKEAGRTFKNEKCLTSLYPESIASWDYGRLVNLACWCVDCGYIDEDEAWDYIRYANEQSSLLFETWDEFGNSYLFGRYVWSIDSYTHDPMREIFHFLLSNENSPWVRIPFK